MIKIISELVSITSYNRIMLGCLKYFENLISRFTFSSKSLDFRFDFCNIFAAIFCFIISCSPTGNYKDSMKIFINYYLHLTLAKEPSPKVR